MGTLGHGGLALIMTLTVAICPAPAVAQGPTVALEQAADSLRPGDFAWRDDDPLNGEVSIVVSRRSQRAFVMRGDRLIGVASVSTGKPGKTTPLGEFSILQKRVWHRSNLYSNAPMPYMQRLTWGGIALHAGENPGYPASHGCVRLPRPFAILLYGVTRMGAAVVVVDENGAPVSARDFPLLIADTSAFGGDGYAEVTWLPEPFVDRDGLRVSGDEDVVPAVALRPPGLYKSD